MLKVIAVGVLFFVGVFGGSALADRSACYGQWENSGLTVSWGSIKGCMVTLTDGRTIPASAVREVAL